MFHDYTIKIMFINILILDRTKKMIIVNSQEGSSSNIVPEVTDQNSTQQGKKWVYFYLFTVKYYIDIFFYVLNLTILFFFI